MSRVPFGLTRRRCHQALLALGAGWLLPALAARNDVRLGLLLEPPTLDITASPSASIGEMLYANVLEGLTVLDAQGRVAPRLASQWRWSADRLALDLSLRTDVHFHDGHAFDAEVAAHSLQRLIAPESKNPQKKWFERVTQVQATAADRLRITLSAPDPFLTYALALPAAVILHPDTLAQAATQPVGSGPFRVQRWDKGARLVLERFAGHWGRKPALSSATFVFVSNLTEGESLLIDGALDGIISVTDQVDKFKRRPDLQVLKRHVEQKVLLAINNARPPFNDVRVRRALALGIQRENFKHLYGQELQPRLIGSHFAPTHPAFVDLLGRYPYNPAQARALLKAAGVAPGTPLELIAPPTRYGRMGAVSVGEDLSALGFAVQTVNVDWKTWLERVFTRKDYAVSLIAHVEPLDLNIYARDGYYFNYANANFKKLWAQVMNAPNEAELNRRLGLAQRKVTEDAVNAFLFMAPQTYVVKRKLQGFWLATPLPVTVLEDLHWAD